MIPPVSTSGNQRAVHYERVFSNEDVLLDYLRANPISADKLRELLADALQGNPKWERIMLILQRNSNFLTINLANTTLAQAAIHGHSTCLKLILQTGMSTHTGTALQLAAAHGHFECLSILLEEHNSDADVTAALTQSAGNGHFDCLRQILGKHFLPSSAIGMALQRAALQGQTECVRALLDAQPLTLYIEQALESAAKNGKANCIPLLLAKNPRVSWVKHILSSIPVEFSSIITEMEHWLEKKEKEESPPSSSCSIV